MMQAELAQRSACKLQSSFPAAGFGIAHGILQQATQHLLPFLGLREAAGQLCGTAEGQVFVLGDHLNFIVREVAVVDAVPNGNHVDGSSFD
jgi:hypothetical protein